VKFVGGGPLKSGETGKLQCISEKPLPHDNNGLHGIIADFMPFENKLRVVGTF
jgi:hypothetical protein